MPSATCRRSIAHRSADEVLPKAIPPDIHLTKPRTNEDEIASG